MPFATRPGLLAPVAGLVAAFLACPHLATAAEPPVGTATEWTRAEGFGPGKSSPKLFGRGVYFHITAEWPARPGADQEISVRICNSGRSEWRGTASLDAVRPTAGRTTLQLPYLGCQTLIHRAPANAESVWVYTERTSPR